MTKLITNTAKMQCTLGATPAPISVTSQMIVKINNNLVATENDKIPVINIPSFGVCKCASPTPPCIPTPTAWQGTSTLNCINGNNSLTTESFCMCAKGGKISFTDAGLNTFVNEN